MAKGQGVMIAKATSTLATNATKGELKGTKVTNKKEKNKIKNHKKAPSQWPPLSLLFLTVTNKLI